MLVKNSSTLLFGDSREEFTEQIMNIADQSQLVFLIQASILFFSQRYFSFFDKHFSQLLEEFSIKFSIKNYSIVFFSLCYRACESIMQIFLRIIRFCFNKGFNCQTQMDFFFHLQLLCNWKIAFDLLKSIIYLIT